MGQLQGQLQAEVKRLQGQVQQARSEEEEAQEQRHALKLQLTRVSTYNLDMSVLMWEEQAITPFLRLCSVRHPQHAV